VLGLAERVTSDCVVLGTAERVSRLGTGLSVWC
jgi:hypothetical protein